MSEGNSYGHDVQVSLGLSMRQEKIASLIIQTNDLLTQYLVSTDGFGKADDFLREWETMLNSFKEEHPVA